MDSKWGTNTLTCQSGTGATFTVKREGGNKISLRVGGRYCQERPEEENKRVRCNKGGESAGTWETFYIETEGSDVSYGDADRSTATPDLTGEFKAVFYLKGWTTRDGHPEFCSNWSDGVQCAMALGVNTPKLRESQEFEFIRQ